jgi:hypothetical protein
VNFEIPAEPENSQVPINSLHSIKMIATDSRQREKVIRSAAFRLPEEVIHSAGLRSSEDWRLFRVQGACTPLKGSGAARDPADIP